MNQSKTPRGFIYCFGCGDWLLFRQLIPQTEIVICQCGARNVFQEAIQPLGILSSANRKPPLSIRSGDKLDLATRKTLFCLYLLGVLALSNRKVAPTARDD